MKTARFVLKIVAASLAFAAAVCPVVAYWDKLPQLCCGAQQSFSRSRHASEYEDYEED